MTKARFIQSFGFAWSGIVQAFREGRNFKVEMGFAVAAVVLGFALSIDLTQWAIVVVCMGVVLGLECLNTAMEAIVDLASPEYHALAKHAKDCAAGAVFICSIASLFVAALIFLPRILEVVGILR